MVKPFAFFSALAIVEDPGSTLIIFSLILIFGDIIFGFQYGPFLTKSALGVLKLFKLKAPTLFIVLSILVISFRGLFLFLKSVIRTELFSVGILKKLKTFQFTLWVLKIELKVCPLMSAILFLKIKPLASKLQFQFD